MKTVMNELLDWINEFEDKPIKPTYINMKEKIWQLLPKEKQQIVTAHEDGFFRDDDDAEGTTLRSMDELRMEANEYFDKQYKTVSK